MLAPENELVSGKSVAVTLLDAITSGDHRLMNRVNRWRPPRWFRLWMIFATRGGDGWLWYALGLLVLLFGGTERLSAVAAAAAAVASGVGIFIALKRAFRRPRPCVTRTHCWAQLLPPDQFSFPSGHTITAFAMAASLIYFYPVLFVPLAFCAGSIAVSRVLLGMHFLSDVIAGAAIGVMLGYNAAVLLS